MKDLITEARELCEKATLSSKGGNTMRLIDADALMEDIATTTENSGCVNHEGEILDCIAYADEIDAMPVVRCRDCKHFAEYRKEFVPPVEGANGDCYLRLMNSTSEQFSAVTYNDYCSYGKRTEDKPCG